MKALASGRSWSAFLRATLEDKSPGQTGWRRRESNPRLLHAMHCRTYRFVTTSPSLCE